ncbi:NnrU family protein [Jannaschia sp. W003]|uniref:NnrU family protein n=1 Tax=Jannaschia sp. W003 TaxID=2867012 RepID=UPI0021A6C955|nr:NnrU family protein [Jannaschia sp. W003]UWQ21687.1 NnrU family protein [Jannaschia sp. W003]
MIVLVLGLLLWAGAHFFKRIAPDARARLGDRGKGLVALLLVVSVVLMVLGYRAAPADAYWAPPAWTKHLNNLLMLVAFYLFGVGAAKGTTAGWLRHPQLTAVVLWSAAHVLANGEIKALVLFGGLGLWAVAEMIVINRAQPWERPAATSVKGDVKALVIGLVLYAVVAAVHVWLGVWPFGGPA